MGLLYTAAFENISLTDAAQDIIFLATSSAVPIRIHYARFTASVTTDVRARIQLIRRTTAGSGGTGITPSELIGRNTVSPATTCTYLRTTTGTAGDVVAAEQWSLLVPYEYLPVPEQRPEVAASSYIGFNLAAGTGATRTISGYVTFEEF